MNGGVVYVGKESAGIMLAPTFEVIIHNSTVDKGTFKWPIRLALISGFCRKKGLEVLLLPLDGC